MMSAVVSPSPVSRSVRTRPASIVLRPEQRRVTHAGRAAYLVQQVDRRVIRDKQLVMGPLGEYSAITPRSAEDCFLTVTPCFRTSSGSFDKPT